MEKIMPRVALKHRQKMNLLLDTVCVLFIFFRICSAVFVKVWARSSVNDSPVVYVILFLHHSFCLVPDMFFWKDTLSAANWCLDFVIVFKNQTTLEKGHGPCGCFVTVECDNGNHCSSSKVGSASSVRSRTALKSLIWSCPWKAVWHRLF